MSKLFILCGALLCLSLTASAQDSTAAFDASSSAAEPAASAAEPAAPASLLPSDREPWQLGVGFQYQHYTPFYLNFHDLGFNTEVTRYLNNWFGVEGTVVMGFGNTGTTPSRDAKSFFIGGGPHIAFANGSRFEPWGHVLVGWERFRFTESNILGDNSAVAFMAGGGVDYKIGERAYWRVQGDFIGSRIGTTSINRDYSFGTGLVFNF